MNLCVIHLWKKNFDRGKLVSPQRLETAWNRCCDTIIIEPVHGRLKRYDLPLYRRPDGKYVLHRILHVKKNGYVICGDNRWWKENVPDEWIVGVVTEFYRREEHIYITDRKYRLYVHLWCDFFWIRVLILRVKHILQRIKKK